MVIKKLRIDMKSILRTQNRREIINAEPSGEALISSLRFWIQSSIDFIEIYNDIINQSRVKGLISEVLNWEGYTDQ